jgi:plastocyanin
VCAGAADTRGAPAPANGGAGNGYGKKAPATTAAKSPGGAKTPAPAAATLTISNFAFGAPLTVAPGAKVPVRNSDGAPHTVTGSGFDSGTVGGGASGTLSAPTKPGSYAFHCEIHPSMTGSLTVKP